MSDSVKLKLQKLCDQNEDFVFLHSSDDASYSQGRSILASSKCAEVIGDDFASLGPYINTDKKKFEKAWFGYLGYDLKNKVESLTQDKDFFIETPDLHFSSFDSVEQFSCKSLLEDFSKDIKLPEVSYLKSNMTKQEYLDKVMVIKDLINKGDLYQANLTRKFYGEFKSGSGEPRLDVFDIFVKLSQQSPAPFSAFIKNGDTVVISSSPELFLRVEDGNVVTAPIKGSSGKGQSQELSESNKDRAENLMIVDLMRNDLSRSCEVGSVKVNGLFETNEFKTISHMYSTISGKLKPEEDALSVVKSCFPPGSMTGAPKIMAMENCSALELHKRGIYSGALGYFAGNGDAEFSVVIRTIIIQGNKFEFQVGGGIVYDSDPEKEWQETMTKAMAIAKVLGVEDKILEL